MNAAVSVSGNVAQELAALAQFHREITRQLSEANKGILAFARQVTAVQKELLAASRALAESPYVRAKRLKARLTEWLLSSLRRARRRALYERGNAGRGVALTPSRENEAPPREVSQLATHLSGNAPNASLDNPNRTATSASLGVLTELLTNEVR